MAQLCLQMFRSSWPKEVQKQINKLQATFVLKLSYDIQNFVCYIELPAFISHFYFLKYPSW